MNFKELFDKEFLFESSKADAKNTKIFYKFDINIKKIEEQPQGDVNNQVQPAPSPSPDVEATNTTPVTPDVNAQPASLDLGANQPPATDASAQPSADMSATPVIPDVPPSLFSVVTEDEDKNVQVNDENNIIRKMEGEVVLSKEEINDIQTVEDLLTKLTESKVDGVNVLDEFTADILQVIVNPATQPQLKEKVDKESNIFAEILYGKKRENSVGLRVIKRKNSDLLTTSMMIDNKIINAQYKKETLDKRITDYRNDEYDENKTE